MYFTLSQFCRVLYVCKTCLFVTKIYTDTTIFGRLLTSFTLLYVLLEPKSLFLFLCFITCFNCMNVVRNDIQTKKNNNWDHIPLAFLIIPLSLSCHIILVPGTGKSTRTSVLRNLIRNGLSGTVDCWHCLMSLLFMTSQRIPLHYPRRHRRFQWR